MSMAKKPRKQLEKSIQSSIIHVLRLAGHWAEYGGGIPIAAKTGANAALMILKKKSPLHFKQLVLVFEGKKQD